MREVTVDIWSLWDSGVVAITTNGAITRDGRAIPGRGVAKQAAERFPEMRTRLGQQLRLGGNHVYEILPGLVSFPVEETPFSQPDRRLIRQSAEELRQLADQRGWQQIVVPRPGCGGGGLNWKEVRPLLADLFDERFIVVHKN
jgi:hypothetical protein